MKTIKAVRKTTESVMGVILDFSPLAPNYRDKICTPIPFLNHMIEHIPTVQVLTLEQQRNLQILHLSM